MVASSSSSALLIDAPQDDAGVTRIRNADPDEGATLPKERDTFLLLSGPNQSVHAAVLNTTQVLGTDIS